jgi:glutathione S-transferase
MKLYQFAHSPYAAKVRKCLELKGLAFQTVEVPYLDRRELVAHTGGSVVVPVLVDGQTVVADSPRITEYLDQRYEPTLRPPPLTAAATVFESWADHILEDTAFRLTAPTVETHIAEANGGRQDARALYRLIKERKFGVGCLEAWRAQEHELGARFSALTAPLELSLRSQPFLLGDRPTLADAAVYGNAFMIESVLPGRLSALAPGLVDWYARIHQARL